MLGLQGARTIPRQAMLSYQAVLSIKPCSPILPNL
jgi:hypothetical protein